MIHVVFLIIQISLYCGDGKCFLVFVAQGFEKDDSNCVDTTVAEKNRLFI